MEIDTKDNGKMIKLTVLEYIKKKLDINNRVNGKMILKVEKELKLMLMVPVIMENFKMTNNMEGGFKII